MLKFTVRELLMLLTIIGLILGWLVDHREQIETQKSQAKLQQVSDKQFERLIGMMYEEGFLVERDSGGWPMRIVQAPLIQPQSLGRYPGNRDVMRGVDCTVKLPSPPQPQSPRR